jgi:hypothetical protein
MRYGGIDIDEYIRSLYDGRIKLIQLADDCILGDARNILSDNANGSIITPWDDDDWYHKDRLNYMYNFMNTNELNSVVISKVIIYNEINGSAVISYARPWYGSLMYRNEINDGIKYDSMHKGEDFNFTRNIINKDKSSMLLAPHLYVYRFHGANTWDLNHFNILIKTGDPIPYSLTEKIVNAIKFEYELTDDDIIEISSCARSTMIGN